MYIKTGSLRHCVFSPTINIIKIYKVLLYCFKPSRLNGCVRHVFWRKVSVKWQLVKQCSSGIRHRRHGLFQLVLSITVLKQCIDAWRVTQRTHSWWIAWNGAWRMSKWCYLDMWNDTIGTNKRFASIDSLEPLNHGVCLLGPTWVGIFFLTSQTRTWDICHHLTQGGMTSQTAFGQSSFPHTMTFMLAVATHSLTGAMMLFRWKVDGRNIAGELACVP